MSTFVKFLNTFLEARLAMTRNEMVEKLGHLGFDTSKIDDSIPDQLVAEILRCMANSASDTDPEVKGLKQAYHEFGEKGERYFSEAELVGGYKAAKKRNPKLTAREYLGAGKNPDAISVSTAGLLTGRKR